MARWAWRPRAFSPLVLQANGVNPVDYLADVLLRVQTHPASRIDELLPHNWNPPRPEPSA